MVYFLDGTWAETQRARLLMAQCTMLLISKQTQVYILGAEQAAYIKGSYMVNSQRCQTMPISRKSQILVWWKLAQFIGSFVGYLWAITKMVSSRNWSVRLKDTQHEPLYLSAATLNLWDIEATYNDGCTTWHSIIIIMHKDEQAGQVRRAWGMHIISWNVGMQMTCLVRVVPGTTDSPPSTKRNETF